MRRVIGFVALAAASCGGAPSSGTGGTGGSIGAGGGGAAMGTGGGVAGATGGGTGGGTAGTGGAAGTTGGAGAVGGGGGGTGGVAGATGIAGGGGTSSTGAGGRGGTTGTGGGAGRGGAAGGTGGAAGGGGAGRGGAAGGAGGGLGGAGGTAGAAGRGGAGGAPTAGVTRVGQSTVTASGLSYVSYGGYLNGESFQQDGIVSYGGYQYAAFWNVAGQVVLARRMLPSGAWQTIVFTDYTLSAMDAHNTISIGIVPGDGTLHLAFDHHDSDLHYRQSTVGFLGAPGSQAASSFSPVTSALVGTTRVSSLTYPRFVTAPGGNRMLLSARIGQSGSGDEYLWEYDSATHAWRSIGKYIDGTGASVNAYLHGITYTPGGTRLHAAWCWRETPDAQTNHDLFYVYSDDDGRTWRDNAGAVVAVAGSSFVAKSTASARVWTIGQNRGLINQEHMAVDADGVVHVLLSHMPDAQADDADFTSSRTKSEYFHYWRNGSGAWTRGSVAGLKVVANFRGKLAIAPTHNLYAILPDLRIAGASAARGFGDWALLDGIDAGRYFSDPLVDAFRLQVEDTLTVYYPVKSSRNIDALDFRLR